MFFLFVFFLFSQSVCGNDYSRSLDKLDVRQLVHLLEYLVVSGEADGKMSAKAAEGLRKVVSSYVGGQIEGAAKKHQREMFLRYTTAIGFFQNNRSISVGKKRYRAKELMPKLDPLHPSVDRQYARSNSEPSRTISDKQSPQESEKQPASGQKSTDDSFVEIQEGDASAVKSLSASSSFDMGEVPSDEALTYMTDSVFDGVALSGEADAVKLKESLVTSGILGEGSSSWVVFGALSPTSTPEGDEGSDQPSAKKKRDRYKKSKSAPAALEGSGNSLEALTSKKVAKANFQRLIKKMIKRRYELEGVFPDIGANVDEYFELGASGKGHRFDSVKKAGFTQASLDEFEGLRLKLWRTYIVAHAMVIAGSADEKTLDLVKSWKDKPFEVCLKGCYELMEKEQVSLDAAKFFWMEPPVSQKFFATSEDKVLLVKAILPMIESSVEKAAEKGIVSPYHQHIYKRALRVLNVGVSGGPKGKADGRKLVDSIEAAIKSLGEKKDSEDAKDAEKFAVWLKKSGVRLSDKSKLPKLLNIANKGIRSANNTERTRALYACLVLGRVFNAEGVKLDPRMLSEKALDEGRRESGLAGLSTLLEQGVTAEDKDIKDIHKSGIVKGRRALAWFIAQTACSLSDRWGLPHRTLDLVAKVTQPFTDLPSKGLPDVEAVKAVSAALQDYDKKLASSLKDVKHPMIALMSLV